MKAPLKAWRSPLRCLKTPMMPRSPRDAVEVAVRRRREMVTGRAGWVEYWRDWEGKEGMGEGQWSIVVTRGSTTHALWTLWGVRLLNDLLSRGRRYVSRLRGCSRCSTVSTIIGAHECAGVSQVLERLPGGLLIRVTLPTYEILDAGRGVIRDSARNDVWNEELLVVSHCDGRWTLVGSPGELLGRAAKWSQHRDMVDIVNASLAQVVRQLHTEADRARGRIGSDGLEDAARAEETTPELSKRVRFEL
jgi:hypothetical protein